MLIAVADKECWVSGAFGRSHKEFIEQQRRDLLARFGVTGDMVFQKVESLSGGERNRTALPRLAGGGGNPPGAPRLVGVGRELSDPRRANESSRPVGPRRARKGATRV